MDIRKYKVRMEFVTEMLGTAPMDPEVYAEYVPTANAEITAEEMKEELDSLTAQDLSGEDEEAVRGKTIFRRLGDGTCALIDYMIRGFFKEACYACRQSRGTLSAKVTAYKKAIDLGVFVFPRFLPIHLPESLPAYSEVLQREPEGPVEDYSRPLRADTAQGPRVAIATSELAHPGCWIEFELHTTSKKITEEVLREWLDYGKYSGIGQFRSGSFGRFTYELEEIE